MYLFIYFKYNKEEAKRAYPQDCNPPSETTPSHTPNETHSEFVIKGAYIECCESSTCIGT